MPRQFADTPEKNNIANLSVVLPEIVIKRNHAVSEMLEPVCGKLIKVTMTPDNFFKLDFEIEVSKAAPMLNGCEVEAVLILKPKAAVAAEVKNEQNIIR